MEKEKKEGKGRVRIILMGMIRILLVLAFLGALYSGRTLVLWLSAAAFFMSFVPYFLESQFKIRVPAKFEIMLFLFIYGTLFIGDVQGLYDEFWWWSILLNLVAGMALGFIGLSVLYVLYKEKKIDASPVIVSLFSFAFAVAIGSVWEIFEFSIDQIFGFSLQRTGLTGTMGNMIGTSAGAFLVALLGYSYIKNGKLNVVSTFIAKLVEKNPKLFGGNREKEDGFESFKKLIEKGENKNLEFKSTLRTNLFTNQIDKKMEHAVLKTIAAYLNTDGGTLFIGVSDKGEILGLEKDQFPSNDKLNLHFTNLLNNYIGGEFLPFIKPEIIKLGDKHVLKVECTKSQKHVFLKTENGEEFYIRNGPASMKLDGSSLVDYIQHNFMKK